MLPLSIPRKMGQNVHLPLSFSLEVGRDKEVDKAFQPWQQLLGSRGFPLGVKAKRVDSEAWLHRGE